MEKLVTKPEFIHDSAGKIALIPCVYVGYDCYASLSDELDFAIYKDADRECEEFFMDEDHLLYSAFGEAYNSTDEQIKEMAEKLLSMLELKDYKLIGKTIGNVGELKQLLEKVPDNYQVVIGGDIAYGIAIDTENEHMLIDEMKFIEELVGGKHE